MKTLLSHTTAVVAGRGGWRCKTPLLSLPLLLSACITELPGEFPHQEELCRTDTAREQQRAASAANFPAPPDYGIKRKRQHSLDGRRRWRSPADPGR